MNCRRAASFADAQRLSRLRRTHGVFSRLRRTHGVSRAYGGRTASLAPTADAQRLSRLRRTHSVFSRLRRTHGVFSRLRRSLRKQTAKSLLSAPYGKALQRQAKIFIQAKITVPPHVRNRRIKHSKSLTLGIPRVRDCCLSEKLPFRCLVHDYAIVTVQWTHGVFRATAGTQCPFRAMAFTEANRKELAFCSILEA